MTSDRRSRLEIEIKLAGAPGDVAALRGSRLFADWASEPISPAMRLVSTYYDTADGALHAAGISLRLREGAGGLVQTLKRVNKKGEGIVSRAEEEQSLEAREAFPAPLEERKAAKIIQAAQLAPVSRIIADRRAVILENRGTRIEAAIDLGRVEAWRRGAPYRAAPLAEVELELAKGKPKALFRLARALVEESGGRLRPSGLAKADQARRLLGGDAKIPDEPSLKLDRDQLAADALAAALRSIAARLVETAPYITERRLPEGVHQMRIALRRLRSVEQVFRQELETDKLRKLARRAREYAGALGPARDWDVFLEETLAPFESVAGDEEGVASLKARAGALRASAWDDAAELIAAPGFTCFMLEVMEAGHRQAWRKKARKSLRRPARDFAVHALDALLEDARAAARAIDGADPAARHPLRISLKKLRYAAQTFRSLFPRAARKDYLAALSRLQDDLGAVNDAVTAQRLANEAAMGQGKAAAHAAGFVCGFHAAAAESKAAAISEDWRAFAAERPFWREAEDRPDAEDPGHPLP